VVAPDRRALLLALSAAVLALVASVVAAVGPARGESAEYTWPPATLPAGTPSEGWYAPLPLLNRVPASVDVRMPCTLSPALPSDGPITVLATARRPETADALRIVLDGDSLRIRVGEQEAARMPWPGSCPLGVEISGGMLHLPGRDVALRTETLEDMPIVTGLFTGLDLPAGEPPRVVIRTRVYATTQTAKQVVATALAVALGLLATLLLLQRDRRLPSFGLRRRVRTVWQSRDATDAVVVGALLAWWILAPTFTDDGWVWVEQRMLADVGTLSVYYDTWGLSAPLALWMWVGQWVGGSTTDLVFTRLPSLLALLATWPLCRLCLQRVMGSRATPEVRWTLAGAFLVGATAWGMTLRPEPFISLLTVATLAAMVSFARAPRIAPLAIAVPIAVLAATTHPTGIVASAPLLASAPQVFGVLPMRGRRMLPALAALLLTGLALALVLFALDADLTTRLDDAQVLRNGDLHREPWWREHIRYTRFDQYGGWTAVRRLSLALLLLAAIAWLLHRRRSQPGALLLPARSVAIGLLLLAFLPSKWPWHFGALFAVGAVATAAEAVRLFRGQAQPGSRRIRPLLAVAVVGAAALWSWNAVGYWSPLDLEEARWSLGFGIHGYSLWVTAFCLVAALATLVWFVSRSGWVADRVALVAAWMVAAVTFAVVGVTAAILTYDAAISSWTPARQNLEALVGGGSCGLAHQLNGDAEIVDKISDPSIPTLLVPSVGLYFPCATIPRLDGGLVEVPRLVAFQAIAWPLHEHDGPFAAIDDLYELRTIAGRPPAVAVLSVLDEVPGFVRADAIRTDLLDGARAHGTRMTAWSASSIEERVHTFDYPLHLRVVHPRPEREPHEAVAHRVRDLEIADGTAVAPARRR
jgi:hypothetical protein